MNARSALIFSSLLFAPLFACGDGTRPSDKLAPNIELFEAAPASVEAGQSTSLRFRVKDAATVRIDIMNGANVLPDSPMIEGEISTPTLDDTTTFVLTAVGLTGKN